MKVIKKGNSLRKQGGEKKREITTWDTILTSISCSFNATLQKTQRRNPCKFVALERSCQAVSIKLLITKLCKADKFTDNS